MTMAAAIQMVSGLDLQANLDQATELLGQASKAGARLAVLPENFALFGAADEAKLSVAETDDGGPIQDYLSDQARRHGLWLVGGTIPVRQTGSDSRVAASCLVFDETGQRRARYDKVHLFDVDIPGRDERYAESRSTLAGTQITVLDTPLGRLGLAVCYDLRFPEQFRLMADQGVELIALPSAFTAATGRDHWEVLLRARAIENLCYVIAPDQGGVHPGGRETWGDSLVASPWGEILARSARGPSVVLADIDLARMHQIREHFPVLQHRRLKS